MSRCKNLIERFNNTKESVNEADHYGIVADILTNDDVSSDSEMLDFLTDETKFDKAKLKKLISAERTNFMKDKYLKLDVAIKVIKKFI